ncbi:MAG: hypothetical protein SOZ34_08665, partial [Clostridia bacterium]|nr:hypothetical protein [Clostridia bacterium]
ASTLSVVITDNDAARLLAGSASNAIRYEYYKKGVGGYGFVYGSVFLVYGMILLSHKQKKNILRILLWLIISTTSVMIVFASYTTALLMLIVVFILSIYANSNNRNATFLFVVSVILIICFLNPILKFIHDWASDIDLYWITNRIGQLINAENSNSLEGLKRTQLYERSINAFISNPIIGDADIGGHSMILDFVGSYGIVGIFFVIAFFKLINLFKKEANKREGLIYFLLVALLAINTIDQIIFIPIIFFVLPLIISIKRRNVSEDRNNNTLL